MIHFFGHRGLQWWHLCLRLLQQFSKAGLWSNFLLEKLGFMEQIFKKFCVFGNERGELKNYYIFGEKYEQIFSSWKRAWNSGSPAWKRHIILLLLNVSAPPGSINGWYRSLCTCATAPPFALLCNVIKSPAQSKDSGCMPCYCCERAENLLCILSMYNWYLPSS